MWARRNRGNVFVGNLPRDFSDERLAETFDPYGIVLSAAIARDPSTGEKLRYGFVDIATERAATAAVTALDGIEVDGVKLNVRISEKPAKKPGQTPRRLPPVRREFTPRAPRQAPREYDETPPPAGESPAERPFQVQIVRRRTSNFQVERRPLPRRV